MLSPDERMSMRPVFKNAVLENVMLRLASTGSTVSQRLAVANIGDEQQADGAVFHRILIMTLGLADVQPGDQMYVVDLSSKQPPVDFCIDSVDHCLVNHTTELIGRHFTSTEARSGQ